MVTIKNTDSIDARVLLLAAGGFLSVLLFFFLATYSVPAGTVGVVTTFGHVEPNVLQAGLNLKFPWQAVNEVSLRTTELKETTDTPTDEGLVVSLDSSVLYRISPDRAAELYRTVGTDYSGVVIEPTYRSIVRGITADYDAKSLYTSGREVISDRIQAQLTPVLAERGIIVEKVLLRTINLPQKVTDGIQAKLVADQAAQQMEFVLQKESKEADRKVIEAGGISKANAIIASSLSQSYLEWYWINNLHNYQSIAYIPVGNNGLPLFKNVDSPTTTAPTLMPAYSGGGNNSS